MVTDRGRAGGYLGSMEKVLVAPFLLAFTGLMFHFCWVFLKIVVLSLWKRFLEVPLSDPDLLTARQKALWHLEQLPWNDQKVYWESLDLPVGRSCCAS